MNFIDKGDLLSSMMMAQDEETGLQMDDHQLGDQVMTLLIAGYETTANALAWTWYLLAKNPSAMDRLRQEVHQLLGNRLPVFADLARLPYVRMALEESMRLYPPAWMIGRRALGPDEIGGYIVPPDTVIAVCAYTLHRNPAFWDEPDAFNPLRFSAENSQGRHKFAYIPFGAGPRQCIGNNFGLIEASLILACVSQRFELSLAPGIEVQPQALFVLRPNRDLMMTLQH